ncbi:IGBP1/TAP42 family protein [Aspergillus stella-maris]|uniref:IGBP1/TAP42 family protein n=1 Tax=Aspergillus stella-maris TaxID=1810926 RepID=UPI003CCCBBA4
MDQREQPQTLKSVFTDAKREKIALETRPDSNSDAYRSDVNATIAKFEECQRLAAALSMFSSNELLEDISTNDLPYLTLDYHIAELLQRSYTTDREATLQRALGLYEKYLARLDDYELLNKSNKKLYERYVSNPSSFSLTQTNDAATRRDVKITRFREEKELKAKLEYYTENQQKLQSDDDDIRDLYLAEINLYTHQTFQSLDLLAQELTMLSTIRKMPSRPEPSGELDNRGRNKDNKENYSERLDPPMSQLLKGGKFGPILSKDGKPVQPFTIIDRRTQLRDGVFRSGHNLPTMTIEEYLEEEHRRGNVLKGGEPEPVEVDEDDLEKADEETMKARAWDEFTEANPKGSGNTLNRG